MESELRIEERPVVRGGQIVARPMMYLALSYDHRIVDGREAVRGRHAELLTNPAYRAVVGRGMEEDE